MFGFLTALFSGALMSIQGVFNTEITKQTSLWVSSAFVQFTALVVCMVVWVLTDRTGFETLGQIDRPYMLCTGILGALITVTVITAVKQSGPARAAMLIVISQLLVAWIIELSGCFGVEKTAFTWKKFWGMAMAIVGIILFKW